MHGNDRAHALEADRRLDLVRLRVLQHKHQFAVRRAHLVRVHHLVPPADLKDRGKELLVVAHGAVLDEVLAALAFGGDEHARKHRENVGELLLDARDL